MNIRKDKGYKGIFVFLFILVRAFAFSQTAPQGFFLDEWNPKQISFTSYKTALPTPEPATITVTIDTANILNYVSKYVFGQNAHTWGGKYHMSSVLINGIKNLSPNVIRFPGGSLSDNYFWNASNRATCPADLPSTFTGSDLNYGFTNTGWVFTLDNYYDLLAKTNSKGIICVNYAYARVGTSNNPVAAAAHLAADWVRYDKGRTRYWEIGNENYGKWEYGYEIDITKNKDGQPKIISGELYGQHCRIFIDSMRVAAKEVGNDIKIGVVTVGAATTKAVEKDWNKGLMPQIVDKADFLVVHEYYTPVGNHSAKIILDAADITKNSKEYVNSELLKYSNRSQLPVALTEWNSRDTTDHRKISVINGLFASIVLGEALKSGYGLASRWAFLNAKHSLMGGSSEGMTQYAPHPTFFYMYYFQKMLGDKIVSSSITGSESDSIRAYSSTFSTGQIGVVLINKGKKQRTVKLKCKNFKPSTRFYYYELKGEDNVLYSRKVFVNGQTTTEQGGGPANYLAIQPNALSIDNDEIKITIPPYGTLFGVAQNEINSSVSEIKNQLPTVTITPNLANSILVGFEGFINPGVKVYNLKGSVIFESGKLNTNQLVLDIQSKGLKGIYFVNVQGENASVTKKILVN